MTSSFKPQTRKEKSVFWLLWSLGLGFDLGGVLFHQSFVMGVGCGLLLVGCVSVPLLRRKRRMLG